jgi:uncharacterized protein involved in type VI secretion and phage assembly
MAQVALGQLAKGQQSEYFGKYRGVVTENVDTLGRGRLRVQVPQVLGKVQVWAMPCVPYAGKDRGFFAMPEVGTGVWIEFEAGDPSFPIWVGCFWDKNDISSSDANPKIKFWKTTKFTFRIDDGTGEIVIENDSGSRITISATELVVKSSTVRSEATGGKKTELSAVSFNVNDGALEVL